MSTTDTDSQGPIFWERLRSLFTSSSERRTGPDEPQRRGLVIAVCVTISFVLWLAFTLQEEETVTLDVPTRVVNVPEEQALTVLPPSTVRAQVRGQGLQLLYLYFDPPTVPVDATSNEIDVAEALILSDVRIESVSPQRIEVPKEPRIRRTVPVRSRVQIELASAQELLHPPRLRPDSVSISGARSIVENLNYWPTVATTIENVSDSVSTQVPLADTLSRLVDRSIDRVTLIAHAGRFAEATREIDVEVTGVPSDQDLVALEPSSIRVRYRVLFDQHFEAQRASDFFATVSYDQIRTDTTGYVEPDIHVPSSLFIRDAEPIPSRLRYYTFVSGE